MQRALGYDNSPALLVPLRFFLNIPLFASLAGALVLWAGPVTFTSRWSGASLALTHLFTLGILGSAMLGAMMQILPVACNIRFPHARAAALWVHALLTAGTLTLAAAFLGVHPQLFTVASLLLAASLAGFICLAAAGLWQGRHQVYLGAREILLAVRIALLGLAITGGLGLILASALSRGRSPPGLTDLHALWGLAGWAGILLIGFSFQIIPIFQVTEIYPKLLTRWLAIAIFAGLFSWSVLSAMRISSPTILQIIGLLFLAYCLYAATTFYLLWTRKRPKAEPTTLFWRFAMLCLLGCAPAWLWLTCEHNSSAALVLGSLVIGGVLCSAVNGMLYKIIPFLLWKHAQDAMVIPDHDPTQARAYLRVVPKIAAYLNELHATGQFIAHTLAILAWLGACVFPGWLTYLAGGLFLGSGLWLTTNLICALQLYRRTLCAIAAPPTTMKREV